MVGKRAVESGSIAGRLGGAIFGREETQAYKLQWDDIDDRYHRNAADEHYIYVPYVSSQQKHHSIGGEIDGKAGKSTNSHLDLDCGGDSA